MVLGRLLVREQINGRRRQMRPERRVSRNMGSAIIRQVDGRDGEDVARRVTGSVAQRGERRELRKLLAASLQSSRGWQHGGILAANVVSIRVKRQRGRLSSESMARCKLCLWKQEYQKTPRMAENARAKRDTYLNGWPNGIPWFVQWSLGLVIADGQK